MEKAIDVLGHSLAGIRTGRATRAWWIRPGSGLQIASANEAACLGASGPNQIVIRPYDPGTIKDIEKAIQTSDLGFDPQATAA